MKKIFLLALSCVLLTACNIDLPAIESCFIESASPSGGLVDKRELSPAQLKPLATWFDGLGGDWKFKVVDNFPSGLVLILNHKKDRVTRVNLRGDQLWIGNRFKALTPSEHEELLALISEKNQLPILGR